MEIVMQISKIVLMATKNERKTIADCAQCVLAPSECTYLNDAPGCNQGYFFTIGSVVEKLNKKEKAANAA
jgi:hypothetical protein